MLSTVCMMKLVAGQVSVYVVRPGGSKRNTHRRYIVTVCRAKATRHVAPVVLVSVPIMFGGKAVLLLYTAYWAVMSIKSIMSFFFGVHLLWMTTTSSSMLKVGHEEEES